jgi:hypothetical protein
MAQIVSAASREAKNRRFAFVAQKWCKEVKAIEERQVSSGETGDFHKLINTVVEILQK